MNKLLIATNNPHKVSEFSSVLNSKKSMQLLTLKDFGILLDVTEDGSTLEENALLKSRAVYELMKIPAISDDTGLFVDALGGDPGIYSARYAGENASYDDNCNKLLKNLKDVPEDKRTASFVSVICFYKMPDEYYLFKGICKGKIISEKKGSNGFGYDPLFVPDGMNKTFAELTDAEKNEISHRALALKQFAAFIEKNT